MIAPVEGLAKRPLAFRLASSASSRKNLCHVQPVHGENWAGYMTTDSLRRTTEQQMGKACPTTGSNGNEVHIALLCQALDQ